MLSGALGGTGLAGGLGTALSGIGGNIATTVVSGLMSGGLNAQNISSMALSGLGTALAGPIGGMLGNMVGSKLFGSWQRESEWVRASITGLEGKFDKGFKEVNKGLIGGGERVGYEQLDPEKVKQLNQYLGETKKAIEGLSDSLGVSSDSLVASMSTFSGHIEAMEDKGEAWFDERMAETRVRMLQHAINQLIVVDDTLDSSATIGTNIANSLQNQVSNVMEQMTHVSEVAYDEATRASTWSGDLDRVLGSGEVNSEKVHQQVTDRINSFIAATDWQQYNVDGTVDTQGIQDKLSAEIQATFQSLGVNDIPKDTFDSLANGFATQIASSLNYALNGISSDLVVTDNIGFYQTLQTMVSQFDATEIENADQVLNSFIEGMMQLKDNFVAAGLDTNFITTDLIESYGGIGGSLEELSSQISFYADNFISEATKQAAKIQQSIPKLGTAATAITGTEATAFTSGVAMDTIPKTREDFVLLMDSIDATSASGQKLFKTLMENAEAFDSYYDALDYFNEKFLNKSADEINKSSDTRSIQSGIQLAVDTLAKAGVELPEVFSGLNDNLPATKQQFIDLVLSLDDTTAVGMQAKAALLSLAPTVEEFFSTTAEAVTTAASAGNLMLDTLKQNIQGLKEAFTDSDISNLLKTALEEGTSAADVGKRFAASFEESFRQKMLDTALSTVSTMIMQSVVTPMMEAASLSATQQIQAASVAGATNVEAANIAASTNVQAANVAGNIDTQAASVAGNIDTQAASVAANADVTSASTSATTNIAGASMAAQALAAGGQIAADYIAGVVEDVKSTLTVMQSVMENQDIKDMMSEITPTMEAIGTSFAETVSTPAAITAPDVTSKWESNIASQVEEANNAKSEAEQSATEAAKAADEALKGLNDSLDSFIDNLSQFNEAYNENQTTVLELMDKYSELDVMQKAATMSTADMAAMLQQEGKEGLLRLANQASSAINAATATIGNGMLSASDVMSVASATAVDNIATGNEVARKRMADVATGVDISAIVNQEQAAADAQMAALNQQTEAATGQINKLNEQTAALNQQAEATEATTGKIEQQKELLETFSADIENYLKAKQEIEKGIQSFNETIGQMSSTFNQTDLDIQAFTDLIPGLSEQFPQLSNILDVTDAETVIQQFQATIGSLAPEELVLLADSMGISYDTLLESSSTYISALKEQQQKLEETKASLSELLVTMDTNRQSIDAFGNSTGFLDYFGTNVQNLSAAIQQVDLTEVAQQLYNLADTDPNAFYALSETLGLTTDEMVNLVKAAEEVQQKFKETRGSFVALYTNVDDNRKLLDDFGNSTGFLDYFGTNVQNLSASLASTDFQGIAEDLVYLMDTDPQGFYDLIDTLGITEEQAVALVTAGKELNKTFNDTRDSFATFGSIVNSNQKLLDDFGKSAGFLKKFGNNVQHFSSVAAGIDLSELTKDITYLIDTDPQGFYELIDTLGITETQALELVSAIDEVQKSFAEYKNSLLQYTQEMDTYDAKVTKLAEQYPELDIKGIAENMNTKELAEYLDTLTMTDWQEVADLTGKGIEDIQKDSLELLQIKQDNEEKGLEQAKSFAQDYMSIMDTLGDVDTKIADSIDKIKQSSNLITDINNTYDKLTTGYQGDQPDIYQDPEALKKRAEIADQLQQKIVERYNTEKDFITEIHNKFQEALVSLKDSITETFGNVRDSIADDLTELTDKRSKVEKLAGYKDTLSKGLSLEPQVAKAKGLEQQILSAGAFADTTALKQQYENALKDINGGVDDYMKTVDKYRELLKAGADEQKDAIEKQKEALGNQKAAIDNQKAAIKELNDTQLAAIDSLTTSITDATAAFHKSIADAIEQVQEVNKLAKIPELEAAIPTQLVPDINSVISGITGMAAQISSAMDSTKQAELNVAVAKGSNQSEQAIAAIEATSEATKQANSETIDNLKQGINDLVDNSKQQIQQNIDKLTELKDLYLEYYNQMKDAITNRYTQEIDALESLLDTLTSDIQNVQDAIAGNISDITYKDETAVEKKTRLATGVYQPLDTTGIQETLEQAAGIREKLLDINLPKNMQATLEKDYKKLLDGMGGDIKDRIKQAESYRQAIIDAAEEEKSALEEKHQKELDYIDRMKKLAIDLKDTVKELKMDESLTTYSHSQRLAMAGTDFNVLMKQAKSTDKETALAAAEKLPEAAKSLLTLGKEQYGSTGKYKELFKGVTDQLDALGISFDEQATKATNFEETSYASELKQIEDNSLAELNKLNEFLDTTKSLVSDAIVSNEDLLQEEMNARLQALQTDVVEKLTALDTTLYQLEQVDLAALDNASLAIQATTDANTAKLDNDLLQLDNSIAALDANLAQVDLDLVAELQWLDENLQTVQQQATEVLNSAILADKDETKATLDNLQLATITELQNLQMIVQAAMDNATNTLAGQLITLGNQFGISMQELPAAIEAKLGSILGDKLGQVVSAVNSINVSSPVSNVQDAADVKPKVTKEPVATTKKPEKWSDAEIQAAVNQVYDKYAEVGGIAGNKDAAWEIYNLFKKHNVSSAEVSKAVDVPQKDILAIAEKYGIPKFATGGMVDQPTIALIGEAGKEYIVPEDFVTEYRSIIDEKAKDNATNGSPVIIVNNSKEESDNKDEQEIKQLLKELIAIKKKQDNGNAAETQRLLMELLKSNTTNSDKIKASVDKSANDITTTLRNKQGKRN